MASRITDEQAAAIRDALAPVLEAGVTTPTRLPALAAAIRGMPEPPFAAPELADMTAALELVGLPLAERAAWEAPGSDSGRARGLFVVFEGLDRSGKSTQSKELVKRLEGRGPVHWMCFPDRTTAIGTLIDLYLQRRLELPDETIHMLFCANRWESLPKMLDLLRGGTSIVCDRYAFSGVAYSAAKGLDFEWCKALDVGIPAPDAVFFLRVDPSVGKSRSSYGDERYENEALQTAVRGQFDRAELHAEVRWTTVNGARSIETIRDEIGQVVDALQGPAEGPRLRLSPLLRLWA